MFDTSKQPLQPQNSLKQPQQYFHLEGRKIKKNSDSGRKIPFLVPVPGQEMEFSSLSSKKNFGLFLTFFAENGQEGLKHPFWVQKRGGTFFLDDVKKHELDIRNYR